MKFAFSIFFNSNNTVNLSINKRIVQTVAIKNNKNKLVDFVKSMDVHRNLRAKLVERLENALTVLSIYEGDIGKFTMNGEPAIAIYNGDKAIVIACDVSGKKKVWKTMHTELNMHHGLNKQYAAVQTGSFTELNAKIEFKTEQKVEDMHEKIKQLEAALAALNEENKNLRKENVILKKNKEDITIDEEWFLFENSKSFAEDVESLDNKEELVTLFSDSNNEQIITQPVENNNNPNETKQDKFVKNQEIIAIIPDSEHIESIVYDIDSTCGLTSRTDAL